MLLYPLLYRGEYTSAKLVMQAEYCDKTYHLVDLIRGIHMKGPGYKMLEGWLGFKRGDGQSWESMSSAGDEMAGRLEDYRHISGDLNITR